MYMMRYTDRHGRKRVIYSLDMVDLWETERMRVGGYVQTVEQVTRPTPRQAMAANKRYGVISGLRYKNVNKILSTFR